MDDGAELRKHAPGIGTKFLILKHWCPFLMKEFIRNQHDRSEADPTKGSYGTESGEFHVNGQNSLCPVPLDLFPGFAVNCICSPNPSLFGQAALSGQSFIQSETERIIIAYWGRLIVPTRSFLAQPPCRYKQVTRTQGWSQRSAPPVDDDPARP